MTGTAGPESGAIRVREGLRRGDLAALAALTAGTARPLTAQELALLVLVDPDPRSSIVLVAEDSGDTEDTEAAAGHPAPVGFAHIAAQDGAAYLVSGAVHPAHRRRGIGTRLLDAALAHARRWGAETLVVSGRPRGYAAPGVDEAADPGAAAFLRARGAHGAGSALAMERDLAELADLAGQADRALPPDLRIAPCAPEEVPEMLTAVRLHLSEDWAQLLGAHVAHRAEEEARGHPSAEGQLGPAGTILLARDAAGPAGEILGVAAWDVVGADPERFGPIGVLPAARGRGVGGALLDAALERMARAGARRAWCQWTSASGPAHRMYLSRGFRPLATTTPFELPVRPAAVPIPAVPTPKERTRP